MAYEEIAWYCNTGLWLLWKDKNVNKINSGNTLKLPHLLQEALILNETQHMQNISDRAWSWDRFVLVLTRQYKIIQLE